MHKGEEHEFNFFFLSVWRLETDPRNPNAELHSVMEEPHARSK